MADPTIAVRRASYGMPANDPPEIAPGAGDAGAILRNSQLVARKTGLARPQGGGPSGETRPGGGPAGGGPTTAEDLLTQIHALGSNLPGTERARFLDALEAYKNAVTEGLRQMRDAPDPMTAPVQDGLAPNYEYTPGGATPPGYVPAGQAFDGGPSDYTPRAPDNYTPPAPLNTPPGQMQANAGGPFLPRKPGVPMPRPKPLGVADVAAARGY